MGTVVRWPWCFVPVVLIAMAGRGVLAADEPYRSPQDLALSSDGKLLAVSDPTANRLVFIELGPGRVRGETVLYGVPGQVAWEPAGSIALSPEYGWGGTAEVSALDSKLIGHIRIEDFPARDKARALAVAPNTGQLLIGTVEPPRLIMQEPWQSRLVEHDPIELPREPFWIAVSPDESTAVVTNLIPRGSALDKNYSAEVSLIDLGKRVCAANIKLPQTSTNVRQAAISRDGHYAYVVHTIGRTWLPAVQLERGWVSTNALSIIDLKERSLYATVLLDSPVEGAADPWGLALSPDGTVLCVTLAGAQQLARIDLAGLHRMLPADRDQRMALANDLSGLYASKLIQRFEVPGQGPRGIVFHPDGKSVSVACYYSGTVLKIDASNGRLIQSTALGQSKAPDDVRRGEMIFHDARYCFQHWLSCATCHPNNGRVDGLNWDLPNDGIGNPKNVKSLVYSHRMSPTTWRGVRESMATSTAAGFRFLMHQATPDDVRATEAYLASLKPEPSPYRLSSGQLSPAAQRGNLIFHGDQARCAHCHAGELFTDSKLHDVGTKGNYDPVGQESFVTPSLIELWRTAPYLHDGRAATLKDVISKFNVDDQHGRVSQLSKQQVEDLVEYLKSL